MTVDMVLQYERKDVYRGENRGMNQIICTGKDQINNHKYFQFRI